MTRCWNWLPGWPLLAVALLTAACGPDVEQRLAEIEKAQRDGRYEESTAALRAILADDPTQVRALRLLGCALLNTGRASKAISPLQRAAADPQQAVRAGVLLAAAFLSTRNLEGSIQAATQVLAADPDYVEALVLRARAARELPDPAQSLADADRLLALGRDTAEALDLRASALVALERLPEAEQSYLRLAEVTADGSPSVRALACLALAEFYAAHDPETDRAQSTFDACLEAHPADRRLLASATELHERIGTVDQALERWRQAIQIVPNELALRRGLANLLHRQGRVDDARSVLQQAARELDSADAWANLAELYRRSGEARQAEAAIAEAIERGGADPALLRFYQADLLIDLQEVDRAAALAKDFEDSVYRDLILGRVNLARGDAEGALRSFAAGVHQWPNNAPARYLSGLAAESLGRFDRALSAYREAVRVDETATDAALAAARLHLALGEPALAGEFARRHIRSRPFTGPDAHRIAASSAAALGDAAEAERQLASLEAIEGQRQPAWLERASIERRQHGAKAAAWVIRDSGLDLSQPDHEPALRSLVRDLLELGQVREALKRVESALSDHPELAALHDLHGRVLLAAGRKAEAKKAFQRTLAIDAASAPALVGLATVSAEEGRVEEAIALLANAAALESDDGSAAYRGAQLLLSQDRKVQAETLLRDVVRRHPGHADACNDLAWLLAESGEDPDLALDLARRATRLSPDPSSFDTLGFTHLKRGEARAAAMAFERAVAHPQAAAGYHYHLGLALLQLGQRARAEASFRLALAQGPFPDADAARTQIARLRAGKSAL